MLYLVIWIENKNPMKTNLISLTLLAATMLLSSNCETDEDTNDLLTKELSLGDTVELQQSIIYQPTGSDLSILFDSIVNDSRCPSNVQCITMGNAKAAITIYRKDQEANVTLNTHPDNQQVIRKDGFNIQLIDVLPYPATSDPIPPKDYTIRMVVTKADTDDWHYGKVVDYTRLDGCNLLIELNSGTLLEPAVIEPDFTLRAGQNLIFQYEELHDRKSICMAGPIIKITAITIDSDCEMPYADDSTNVQ